MGDSTRQRPVIDLDELERQLRAAAGSRGSSSPQAAHSDDPLAELARIVGQDDAGRGQWNDQGAAAERVPSRPPAPNFDDLIAAARRRDTHEARHEPAIATQQGHVSQQWEQAAFEQAERALRTPSRDDRYPPVRHDPHDYVEETDPVYVAEGQLPPHPVPLPPRKPPLGRRGWLAMGAIVGVAVVGVAGAMVMRSPAGAKLAAGSPPLIKADPAPSKVAPENPGGIEAPNQDRQIYAKGTSEDLKGVKIVGGEEQPVDVAQATRKDVSQPPAAASAPAAQQQTASTSTSPSVDPAALPRPAVAVVPGLGETRKVKTVSVRPDGTIIDAPAAPAAAPEPPPAPAPPARVASLIPTMEMPAAVAAPAPAAAKPKPASTTATTSTTPAKPKPDAPASAGTSPVAAATPKPPKPTQIASAPADDGSAIPAPAGSGGWAAQLAAPISEQEARETSSRLEKRFAEELGGLKPVIRKADVNGRTVYRVRVTGLAKDDATALCSKLQSAGGQCFVAKN